MFCVQKVWNSTSYFTIYIYIFQETEDMTYSSTMSRILVCVWGFCFVLYENPIENDVAKISVETAWKSKVKFYQHSLKVRHLNGIEGGAFFCRIDITCNILALWIHTILLKTIFLHYFCNHNIT